MPYYIKFAYNNKMKKFIVNDPKSINLNQIKSSFVPSISMHSKLIFDISCPQKEVFTLQSESELLQYFLKEKFADGVSIKVQVIEVFQKKNGESDDQQFYDQYFFNSSITKTRSKSEQIQSDLLTNQFDVSQTQEFLVRSMNLSNSQISETEQFIKRKEVQLQKLKEQRRETNIMELLQFLIRRKS